MNKFLLGDIRGVRQALCIVAGAVQREALHQVRRLCGCARRACVCVCPGQVHGDQRRHLSRRHNHQRHPIDLNDKANPRDTERKAAR